MKDAVRSWSCSHQQRIYCLLLQSQCGVAFYIRTVWHLVCVCVCSSVCTADSHNMEWIGINQAANSIKPFVQHILSQLGSLSAYERTEWGREDRVCGKQWRQWKVKVHPYTTWTDIVCEPNWDGKVPIESQCTDIQAHTHTHKSKWRKSK